MCVQVSMADGGRMDRDDLVQALEFASHNLKLRHEIDVKMSHFDGFHATLVVHSDKSLDHFVPGRRLRGISAWMMRNRRDEYESRCVGKRLMLFREVDGDGMHDYDHVTSDEADMLEWRMSLVSDVTRLCLLHSKAALDALQRVHEIVQQALK